jgi:RNA polymerase sigma factor (sigma-70 family)
MTDETILKQLKNDHYAQAVQGLYNILPLVRKYVATNSGSVEDARDIFQDALVVLYRKATSGDFTFHGSLKAYIMGVVKNLWMKELRQRKKMPRDEAGNDIADIPHPEEETAFTSAKAAFNLLGEKCRQLLILFYFKKKSLREIAAELSFSDEMVAKNQKYRCMQKAKEHYESLSKTGNNGYE